jgi:hypothetical protein
VYDSFRESDILSVKGSQRVMKKKKIVKQRPSKTRSEREKIYFDNIPKKSAVRHTENEI